MESLPLEEVLIGCPRAQEQEEKKLSKPQPEQSLKCPRCESTNTKFCYYNNYSLSQPRYFCKGCRRYWTKGGSLRNVPVGGGCRKNRKSSSTSSSKSKPQDQLQPFANPHPPLPAAASSLLPPLLAYDPNELTLALARLQKQPHNPEPPYLVGNPNLDILGNDHIPTGGGGGGFHNLYCGYKCEEMIQPFGGDGFGGATATAATTVTTTSQISCKDAGVQGEDKMGMELQWPIGGDCIMGLETGGRDHYWINGVGSNWQSLINSSLI